MLDRSVALLERKPSFDSLEIVEGSLGFHGDSPSVPTDQRIPCPPVALDGKRDLGAPVEIRSDLRP